MNVQWVTVYYPFGEWRGLDGEVVNISGNFRAMHEGVNVIVMMRKATGASGHGEPPVTAFRPSYIDEDNLEWLDLDGKFIATK